MEYHIAFHHVGMQCHVVHSICLHIFEPLRICKQEQRSNRQRECDTNGDEGHNDRKREGENEGRRKGGKERRRERDKERRKEEREETM